MESFKRLAPELFPDSYLDRLVEIIGPQFDKEYAFHVHEEMGMPPVLIHGDLHNNNLMWTKKMDGSGTTDELAVIVDWQVQSTLSTHFGYEPMLWDNVLLYR